MHANRGETAKIIGIEPTTLDAWVAKGCPVVDRPGQGRAATFDTQAVLSWWVAREVDKALDRAAQGADRADLSEWQTRKIAAQAQLAEIEVLRAKGELVLADELGRALHDIIIGGREYVCHVAPGRIARRVVGETDQTKITATAREEIEQALHGWADKDILGAVEKVGGKLSDEALSGPCPMCVARAAIAAGEADV